MERDLEKKLGPVDRIVSVYLPTENKCKDFPSTCKRITWDVLNDVSSYPSSHGHRVALGTNTEHPGTRKPTSQTPH